MNPDPIAPADLVATMTPAHPEHPVYWFIFRGDELVLPDRRGPMVIPQAMDFPFPDLAPQHLHCLGQLGGRDVMAAGLPPDAALPGGWLTLGLRPLFGQVSDVLFWAAARAFQIIDWERTHRFCGRCGTATRPLANERAMACPACGLHCFPRVAPAIIVRIDRGDEILLCHAHRLPEGMHSLVAGFVEPAETLEQAAIREIREEVGLEVANLRYFDSQPWPFPHSLMVGFIADYAGGDIRCEPTEIGGAGWFRHDRMPNIPGPISIARKLIDDYLRRHQHEPDCAQNWSRE